MTRDPDTCATAFSNTLEVVPRARSILYSTTAFERSIMDWLEAAFNKCVANAAGEDCLSRLTLMCQQATQMWPGDLQVLRLTEAADTLRSRANADSSLERLTGLIKGCFVDEGSPANPPAALKMALSVDVGDVIVKPDSEAEVSLAVIVSDIKDEYAAGRLPLETCMQIVDFAARHVDAKSPNAQSFRHFVRIGKKYALAASALASYKEKIPAEAVYVAQDPEWIYIKELLGHAANLKLEVETVVREDGAPSAKFNADIATFDADICGIRDAMVASFMEPLRAKIAECTPIAGGDVEGKMWHSTLDPKTATITDVIDLVIQDGGLMGKQDLSPHCVDITKLKSGVAGVHALFGIPEPVDVLLESEALVSLMLKTRSEQLLAGMFSTDGLAKFAPDQREAKVRSIRTSMGGAKAFAKVFSALHKRAMEALKGK